MRGTNHTPSPNALGTPCLFLAMVLSPCCSCYVAGAVWSSASLDPPGRSSGLRCFLCSVSLVCVTHITRPHSSALPRPLPPLSPSPLSPSPSLPLPSPTPLSLSPPALGRPSRLASLAPQLTPVLTPAQTETMSSPQRITLPSRSDWLLVGAQAP